MDKTTSRRFAIWTFDDEFTLDFIQELLMLDYLKEIPYLKDRTDLSTTEKMAFNMWRPYSEQVGLSIHRIEVGPVKVQTISAKACFETFGSETNAVINGIVLPRDRRVTYHEEPVFFFNINSKVYAVVLGSEYMDSKVRSSLMGASKPRDIRHEGWRKIVFNNIEPYEFSVDFFYWLITNQDEVIRIGDYEINLSDIHSLDQSLERNDVSQVVTGAHLLVEPMATTGLSVDSDVKAVGITVNIPEGMFKIDILCTGECYIDPLLSRLFGPRGEFLPIDNNLGFVVAFLYAALLPALNEAYNKDVEVGNWTISKRAIARKQWALGVINELCSQNKITLSEVEGIDWYRSTKNKD